MNSVTLIINVIYVKYTYTYILKDIKKSDLKYT